MRPPNPIFLLKAGIRNMTDFAVMWHLALCGLTGSGMQEIADARKLHAVGIPASVILGQNAKGDAPGATETK